MSELAVLLVIIFSIVFIVLMSAIAAWGIWSKGYSQGYNAGLKEKINASGRMIYEPYKLEPPC